MDKKKKEYLELAINHYSLKSANEIFSMIEAKKFEDIKQGLNNDVLIYLPKQSTGDNKSIQILGTNISDLFLIQRINHDKLDGSPRFYFSHEVVKFFRLKKLNKILTNN